ncbi:MAG: ParB/RepB/Spo0J family partition protein, partial [Clostridia bacterium]|nr:ParB/RepB/Spo0J family partition protein [Clostridia bacterium]
MWKRKARGEKLLNLSPDGIMLRPTAIRQGEDEDLAALTESVGRYGVIEPLTVRPRGGGYEVILGARRLLAARAAGLERVPCRVIACTQREAVELALEENRKRRPLSLFEEAEALEKLLTHYRVDRNEAAARLGMSLSALANKLRLLQFTREERRLIAENCLSERCARTLLRLNDESARAAALALVVERGYTARQTENLVEAMLERPEEFTPGSLRFPARRP